VRTRSHALIAAPALLLLACSSSASSVTSVPPAADLTVYAAASLKAALATAKTTYETAHPEIALTISTDSSAALETKIEQGAPADIFLSADTGNPQQLVDKGLTVSGVTKFAGNLLTVIVPVANPAGIQTPKDLANSGVKIIAAGDAVPITKYANQLVANLAREPGYPADFVARYTANIATKEDNVSAVVAKVELGEGDAGIVYVTDARTSTRVGTVAVPATANVPATYGGVVVKDSSRLAAAQAFLAWLAGPDGQAVLAGFGFLPPS
jgi:molybdate transport system substrate-binding protein